MKQVPPRRWMWCCTALACRSSDGAMTNTAPAGGCGLGIGLVVIGHGVVRLGACVDVAAGFVLHAGELGRVEVERHAHRGAVGLCRFEVGERPGAVSQVGGLGTEHK